jgi:uncharacterized membrane protein
MVRRRTDNTGVEKSTGGDGMRRRVIGAMLTILGVLVVLFAPAWGVVGCTDFTDRPGVCRDCGSDSLSGFIHWPPGWDKLFLPMLITGVALVVTGIVLLFKARRFRVSPGAAR